MTNSHSSLNIIKCETRPFLGLNRIILSEREESRGAFGELKRGLCMLKVFFLKKKEEYVVQHKKIMFTFATFSKRYYRPFKI
mgnify:FL=1